MASSDVKMPGTPPGWFNSLMRAMLRTPGLRRVIGRSFAVITVTGAVSGRTYSTPVQYTRLDDRIVVLSQVTRTWWRNIARQPTVQLLVRGRTIEAHAEIADGESARAALEACLARNPRTAKFYGIDIDATRAIDPSDIERLLERVVPIVIDTGD